MVKERYFINGHHQELEYDVENQCPFCGKFNSPKRILDMFNYTDNLKVVVLVFETTCCHKEFLSLYLIEESTTKLIATYPTGSPDVFPQTIQDLSPSFVKIHTQAKTAENNGHFELASTGYRNSLEFLIKDFAIKCLGKTSEEVAPKTLYKAIEDYLPNESLIKSADVVRILGNDNTHYTKKYPNLELPTLKKYLKYFIDIIERECDLSNPPVSR